MRIQSILDGAGGRRVLPLVALVVAFGACGLDEQSVPPITGPATLGLSLKIGASPDVITADGFSTSSIQVQAFDQNGKPAAGRDLFFKITDESGNDSDVGDLTSPSGAPLVQGTAIARTNGNGIAQVVYIAPQRTDVTANTSVQIAARPLLDDANASQYRRVRIEIRSAEPRLFPQVPGNTLPLCSFVAQPVKTAYKLNEQVLFQTTSSDRDGVIVRYQWDFGDGSKGDDKPDVNHSWFLEGTFTVTHVVTDDDGGQASCPKTVRIE